CGSFPSPNRHAGVGISSRRSMLPAADDTAQLFYLIAWWSLLGIVIVYACVGFSLRWRPKKGARVTRYEPPAGISPALAAFLVESGRCERSFAASLISLA